ncbi:hypothetical protein [Brevundimonas nasdae]|nr:hypothetical protein [Brevundimonas nasdae]
MGRYENGFERGCEGVTAEYTRRDDGPCRRAQHLSSGRR